MSLVQRCVASTMRIVPASRAHDQALRCWRRRPRSARPEQLAVGDAGGGEEHVVAGHEVVGREDGVEVVAGARAPLRSSSLRGHSRPWISPPMHFSAAGGDDAFGRAADAEQHVGAGCGRAGGDRAGDVAVGDQPDAGPAARTSAMSSVWRSRSRITAVTSLTFSPLGLGDPSRFCVGAGA